MFSFPTASIHYSCNFIHKQRKESRARERERKREREREVGLEGGGGVGVVMGDRIKTIRDTEMEGERESEKKETERGA